MTSSLISVKAIERFVALALTPFDPDNWDKERFHKDGRRILILIAGRLGLPKSDYDLRNNRGGVAVSGEVMLHANHLYVQFASTSVRHCFLYRGTRSRADYAGFSNQWMPYDRLNDIDAVVAEFRATMAAAQRSVVKEQECKPSSSGSGT